MRLADRMGWTARTASASISARAVLNSSWWCYWCSVSDRGFIVTCDNTVIESLAQYSTISSGLTSQDWMKRSMTTWLLSCWKVSQRSLRWPLLSSKLSFHSTWRVSIQRFSLASLPLWLRVSQHCELPQHPPFFPLYNSNVGLWPISRSLSCCNLY